MKKPSDQQFDDAIELRRLKKAIRRRIRGNGPAPAANREAYFVRNRYANELIKRLLRKTKKSWQPPVVDTDMLPYRARPASALLDSLLPKRHSRWIVPLKRKRTEELTIERLSFLDEPVSTLASLAEIARCDAECAKYLIHFDMRYCEDIAPFVVLGLMRRAMTPAATGGRMSRSVARVLEAVALRRFLRMRLPSDDKRWNIWPLALREKEIWAPDSPNQAFDAQLKEKVTDHFVSAIDEWLRSAGTDDHHYELTKVGKGRIGNIFSELLDNAERHTVPENDRAGGWHVAGFMAARDVGDKRQFICHLCIISLGATIGESLAGAQEPEIALALDRYCRRHRGQFGNDVDADNLLRTVCALQDRVSRYAQCGDNPHGGLGLMAMIDIVNKLGEAPLGAVQPQVAIYSGRACILLRAPYNCGIVDDPELNSPTTLWFNKENKRELPPDPRHVFNGDTRFPGTIVSARFSIDEQYFANRETR